MATFNKVILVGNLGGDPELRYTRDGKAVASFSVATQRGKDQPPDWHRVTVWERQAETCAEYLKKGSAVMVEGRLQYSKYTDRDNVERTSADIVASQVVFLGSGRGDGDRRDDRGGSRSEPRREERRSDPREESGADVAQRMRTGQAQPTVPLDADAYVDEDDIPF